MLVKSLFPFCDSPHRTGPAVPWRFAAAAAVVIIWAIAGPFFGFSDVWQLTINTGTTIVTFLMVFLIQNSQNRDTKALQIKMDELIRATKGASNTLIDLENMTEARGQADVHLLDRQVELLGDDHRRRGGDALAHLHARQRERGGAVLVDRDGDQLRGGRAASVCASSRS